MCENVDGRTDDGVTGTLIAHLGVFGSGELKMWLGPNPLPDRLHGVDYNLQTKEAS